MVSLALPLLLAAPAAGDLAPPVLLRADGKPINVAVGHAAPLVADVQGTGTPQLLVGQFGEGKLRLYPNVGSRAKPRFAGFSLVQAGGQDCKVPSG